VIKLILSDMDNTLVPFGAGRASQRTVDAIHACQEQGIDFGPASGRDRGELSGFFGDDASCFNTGVLVNGQKVYYLGEVVYEKTLPADELRRAEEIAAGVEGVAFITYRDDNSGDWTGATAEELGDMYDRVFMCGGRYHELDRMPDYPVVKAGLVVMGDNSRAVELSRRLADACPSLIFPNTVLNWLDVTPKGWGKADGIAILQRILGLSDEEVCVFGDADNDLDMLRRYPNSCAVANANEAATKAARWHVGASADDGVARAMEQIAAAAEQSRATGREVMPEFMRG
jgi:HAD superfamily hydrolase (TIGR01484 family)